MGSSLIHIPSGYQFLGTPLGGSICITKECQAPLCLSPSASPSRGSGRSVRSMEFHHSICLPSSSTHIAVSLETPEGVSTCAHNFTVLAEEALVASSNVPQREPSKENPSAPPTSDAGQIHSFKPTEAGTSSMEN